MVARLKLTSLPGFDTDVFALPTPAARKMALDMLVLVRDGRVRGVKLGQHVQTGDLSDCFKLYFDPDGSSTGSCTGTRPQRSKRSRSKPSRSASGADSRSTFARQIASTAAESMLHLESHRVPASSWQR